MSLVSVVMPVYNGTQFLQESINSILEQSHDELEFIIIDDASTEPVLDLISDYLMRHDADDISLAVRVDEQLKLFTKGVGFVGCWASSINANNELIKGFVDEHCCNRDDIFSARYKEEVCMADATTMYSKKAIAMIGYFDPVMYLGQTYNYNLRVLRYLKGRVVPEVLYLARQHEGQAGRKIRREMREKMDGDFSWSELAQWQAEHLPLIYSSKDQM